MGSKAHRDAKTGSEIVKEKYPNPAPATQPYYLIQSTPRKKNYLKWWET